jgi:uncharacterized protein (TIGR04255 family)
MTQKRDLENPPLKEVVFEVKWDINKVPSGVRKDSSVIAGVLLNKFQDNYPFYEPLEVSAAPIPEEMLSGIAMHRFRVGKDSWPLLQVGVGVFTVNDTNDGAPYNWIDFKNRCVNGLSTLLDSYPVASAITSISIRYINSLDFNYETNNVFSFLSEKMKIGVSLPENLSTEANLTDQPLNFSLAFAYPSSKPNGVLKLLLSSGKNNNKDILIWNIDFTTSNIGLPEFPDDVEGWLEASHLNIENTFFTLIENLDDIIT